MHPATSQSYFAVCPAVWQLGNPRKIRDINCSDTCSNPGTNHACWPSARMATYGELIFHELIHHTSLIEPVPAHLDDIIVDQTFKAMDGKTVAAYDTLYTQMLAKGAEKAKARYNADSYAMSAREVYFTKNCPLIKHKDPDHWEPSSPNRLRPQPPPPATMEL